MTAPQGAPREAGREFAVAAEWHELQIAVMRRQIARAEESSARDNDGERNLGGTWYTEDMPRFIIAHQKSARHFRRLAKAAALPPHPTPEGPQ